MTAASRQCNTAHKAVGYGMLILISASGKNPPRGLRAPAARKATRQTRLEPLAVIESYQSIDRINLSN